MGGQQSTRRLTVVNDEAAGVIKVMPLNTIELKRSRFEKSVSFLFPDFGFGR